MTTLDWKHLQDVLMRYGQYFIEQARKNLGKNKSYASGTLGDTMSPVVEINGNSFKVYVSIQTYWDYVENGRRPGKFPPPNRIKEWIRVKPIKPKPLKDPVESMSYALQKSIAKKRPGKKAPPRKVLVDWIEKKGIKPRELPTTDQLAYLIGHKIAKEGTKPQPFFQPALDEANAHFKDMIDYAILEDIDEWILENIPSL